MPIRITEGLVDPQALKNVPEQYLIFYSSIVDGRSWCPVPISSDCRDVEDLVRQTFGADESPSALIVYVGDRTEWKSPSSIFRAEPWNLTDIPTIIRLRNGAEEARLVEKDIAGGLAEFVKAE
ncbi:hypothetical protein D9615_001194 [Tricholomella constricta]|uniref:Thioredoxin domain-containing protein n=1 Tax=Tricholomella constricta TaxID=117010 RepID=A0A8H5M959_9AGAR|nr:hypothetical protein D9615_001194 [Tricholomella constricta]